MEVRAIEVTDSRIDDAPMLPGLLSQIPEDEPVASVPPSRDHASHDPAEHWTAPVTVALAGTPSRRGADAFVGQRVPRTLCQSSSLPPRRNAKPWKKDSPGARGRNDDLRDEALRADALAQVVRLPPEEPRRDEASRDIATRYPAGQWMNGLELLGQTLMARDFDRQTAELRVRIAILNRVTALRIPATQPVG